MKSPFNLPAADVTGIFNSVLCIIHCLLTPLVLLWFPASHWMEGLQYFFLLISGWAIFQATRHQRHPFIRNLMYGSFGLLLITALLEEKYPPVEYLGYVAATALIGAHLFNIRHCRMCEQKAV